MDHDSEKLQNNKKFYFKDRIFFANSIYSMSH
jgi:hypothetical protein